VTTWIKPHYDKFLHILGTFTLMMFGMIWLSYRSAALIVFALQVIKWLDNYNALPMWIRFRDWVVSHESWGDWVANLCGYGLAVLYCAMEGAV